MLDNINTPLVSVIIPSYNYAHFVLAAIESVIRQDYGSIEIIVIDDGSTDNTAELLAGRTDVLYVRQENQGLSAARNHGVRLAKGAYLQFLDADDVLGRTSIRKRVEFLEEHQDVSAVFCRSAYFKKFPLPERLAWIHKEWRHPDAGCVDVALYYFNIAPVHAFLVRKSVVDRHGLRFDETLRACEDYDFWFRLTSLTGVPGVIRSCWVFYRMHRNSMSRARANQYRHDAELCRRIAKSAFSEEKWLGAKPPEDYCVAMFSAAMLTARRLWKYDRSLFHEFFVGYVIPLGERLAELRTHGLSSAVASLYAARANVCLARMRYNDKALSRSDFDRLSNTALLRPSTWLLLKRGGRVRQTLATFVQLVISGGYDAFISRVLRFFR